ncbi:MAG: carboxypeptidase-like regulatory domain-containing protein [Terriglobia bacterium]
MCPAQRSRRNDQTGVAHQATSNSSGYYKFTFLPPGVYTLTASKKGTHPAIH